MRNGVCHCTRQLPASRLLRSRARLRDSFVFSMLHASHQSELAVKRTVGGQLDSRIAGGRHQSTRITQQFRKAVHNARLGRMRKMKKHLTFACTRVTSNHGCAPSQLVSWQDPKRRNSDFRAVQVGFPLRLVQAVKAPPQNQQTQAHVNATHCP